MFKKIVYLLSITFFISALTACDNKPDPDADNQVRTTAAGGITVFNAHIRALPPGQRVTAMYMELKNTTANDYELVRIEGEISNMIELHTHTNNNGVMQMGEVESIPIPANSTAVAESGGYHVMIMGLQQDLNIGDTVDFKFIFKDGSSIPVTAEVKTIELN